VIIAKDGTRLSRADFEREEELELVVRDFSPDLFGSSIIYIGKPTITTGDGRTTIPDAVVIDLDARIWFLVEVELARHGIWEHIAPQVSRQLAAAGSDATLERLLDKALELISRDPRLQALLQELGISQIDTHGHLRSILQQAPVVAIPIDAVPQDLQDWVRTLRNTVYIWKVEKFIEEGGARIFYSVPDDAGPTLRTVVSPTSGVARIRTASSNSVAELLDRRPDLVGSPVTLDYGPRGGERRRFQGTLRHGGVEVGGQIMSPSAAAVHCMHVAGSQRPTANGWVMWRLPTGELLNDVYENLTGESGGEAA
jgi:hypothetical protein